MPSDINLNEVPNTFGTVELIRCYACYGYYGNSYAQAVCSTCHCFLYKCDVKQDEQREKSDSGDSGNEEPQAAEDFYCADLNGENGDIELCMDFESNTVNRLLERIGHLSCYSSYHKWNNTDENFMSMLPNEVLMNILKYLKCDAIALIRARAACSFLQTLIDRITMNNYWKDAVFQYWPTFKPEYIVENWNIIFAELLRSTTCALCLQSVRDKKKAPLSNKLIWRNKRLENEWKPFDTSSPIGIDAIPLDENMYNWQATIKGPENSVYEGGIFYLHLTVDYNYPLSPPQVRFMTRIFHPNINRHGEIGIDAISHNWTLVMTIYKILVSIQSLLTDPYCFVSMEPQISQLYQKDRPLFDRIAKEWTEKYAKSSSVVPDWHANIIC